jgi:hypothetical protein
MAIRSNIFIITGIFAKFSLENPAQYHVSSGHNCSHSFFFLAEVGNFAEDSAARQNTETLPIFIEGNAFRFPSTMAGRILYSVTQANDGNDGQYRYKK